MNLKPIDIYKLINSNDYKSCRMYEGNINDFSNVRPFEHIQKNSSAELINRLKELEDIVSGQFTLLCGHGLKNEQIRHCKKFNTEFYKTYIQTPINGTPDTNEYVDASTIDLKVNQLLEQKLQQKEKEREIDELRNKVKDLDNFSGKLNYLLSKFLNEYLQKTMQGLTMEEQTQMQGFDTQTKELNLEQSLAVLVNYFGEENIKKFAIKINKGEADSVKPLVVNFINQ